jgi:hypothetical protein
LGEAKVENGPEFGDGLRAVAFSVQTEASAKNFVETWRTFDLRCAFDE